MDSSQESMESLLLQFLTPDNEIRRQAEDRIKRLAKDPQVVASLVHHLRSAANPSVRQLSAVLLRKKITGHWAKLPPSIKQSVKSALLESITVEHCPPVRRASVNVVSIIAKYAVPAGEWPELLPFLFQCNQSPLEDHKEVSLILFSSLTETIGSTFQSNLEELQPVLLKCLQDETSTRVRVAALKAVGSLIEFINDGNDIVRLFRNFIPSILSVSRQCLANGEDDVAAIAFEIFDELIESPAPLLSDSIKSIVQFSLEVCSSQNLEIHIRDQAIQLISWLAKYKSSFLKKHMLVVPILQVICPLLTEKSENEEVDLAVDRSAAEVIDTMAVSLPKHVFPPVFEFASMSIQHSDANYREASVTAIGVISEGCSEFLKEKLDHALHIILGALRDQEQTVRGAALFALGQFAEQLQPEILSHYDLVLPSILIALEDASDEVKEKSYYALAAFCEDMGSDIIPYLDSLMARLVITLEKSNRNLQETCMSAISAIASAAEQAFTPYAEKVLELMKVFMVLTNDEDLRARARATELVGIISLAVGRTRMEPIIPPFIEAAISGFALDYSELREYTHGFFSNLAEMLDDGFSQYLPYVVPLAFSSCNLEDGSAIQNEESDDKDKISGFESVSSDDENPDEPRIRNISVRTGVLDEKAAATQAIGYFALHTKGAYAPYVEESLKILIRHSTYFHEDVRLQAILSLKHVFTSVQAFTGGQSEMMEKQKEVIGILMNIFLKTMMEDDDKEVVAQACTCTAELVKESDYALIAPYIPQLAEVTLTLLREESACQQIESDSETDENDVNHDEVLMDAVCDILPAFARAMRSNFEPIFANLFEPLMKFTKPRRPPQDRTMVVACLAEIAQEMGPSISGYVDRGMPLVLKELSSSDPTNRRNAAFCAGEFCKNGGPPALKYYGEILRALYPLFGDTEPDAAVRDNAAGAVGRMIMAAPQSLPLDQVLPVFLRALPLKEDLMESVIVYGCVCELVLSSAPQIVPLVPEVVSVFGQVLVSPEEGDEVKVRIGMAFSHMVSLFGNQLQPVLAGLPPAQASALASCAARA
ncbi:ARM repeat superfamily protein [Wolffia australiana]